jgi:1-acyl-sn-glycerol-3-phosphate acyltransferase
MSLRILGAFFKTLIYRLRLYGKDATERRDLKLVWGRMILNSFEFELRVIGKPPPDESAILVGNHISYLDIPALMATVPDATFIAKKELKNWPIIGSGAAAAGTIFVDRQAGSDRSEVRDLITQALRRKNTKVVVFPSGTTQLQEMIPWKKGIFEIAQQIQKPIQLFRIEYSPLRESAYIDDDQLLKQMKQLSKFKNKIITLTWLDYYKEVSDPFTFAESLRNRIFLEQDKDFK